MDLMRRLASDAARFVTISATILISLSASGQVVQLPTIHYFGTDSTVSVPDGGMAFLGGVGSAAAGRTQRGIPGLPSRPFRNGAVGRAAVTGNVWVGAQVHDLDAMDQALLAEGAAANNQPAALRPPWAAPKQVNLAGKKSPTAGNAVATESVASIRNRQAAEAQAQQQEAADYLARAQKLLTDGQPGVARMYFYMAAQRTAGEVKQQALAGVQAANQARAAGKVAER